MLAKLANGQRKEKQRGICLLHKISQPSSIGGRGERKKASLVSREAERDV